MTIQEFMSKARQVEALVYKQQILCSQLQNTLEKRKRQQQREFTSLISEEAYEPHTAGSTYIGRCVGVIAGFFYGTVNIFVAQSERLNAERAYLKATGIVASSQQFAEITDKVFLVFFIAIAIGYLIGWIVDLIIFKIKVSEDQSNDAITDQKNMEIREYNLSISQNNDLLAKKHQSQNIAFQQEIQKAKNVLRDIEKVKTEFYKNAPYYIHPKYQDIVAITTFENYLTTRRCTELDGYMGVFNVYEQDRQFGLIMTKMDAIIDRLDTISAYQSALVSLARQTSNEIGRLTNLVDTRTRSISAQLHNIEENTDMTRYYSKVNAEIQAYKLWIDAWE